MEVAREVAKDIAPYVGPSGMCPDDPEILDAINEARRIYYPLGDWKDITDHIAITHTLGVVTLPMQYERIRKAWISCNRVDLKDNWYNPLDAQTFSRCCGHYLGDEFMLIGTNFCVFLDYAFNFRLKIISQSIEDKDKVLNFTTIDELGTKQLLTRTLTKPWFPIWSNPGDDIWIQKILFVEKPVTDDRVQVFIYDPLRDVDRLCAVYEPYEVNPRYTRYRVPGCNAAVPMMAQVKKRFSKLNSFDDLVDIATDALVHGSLAITARKSRNLAEFRANIADGMTYLNRELSDTGGVQSYGLKMSRAYKITNVDF